MAVEMSYGKLWDQLMAMPPAELLDQWRKLDVPGGASSRVYWNEEAGITLADRAQAIYSALNVRGVSEDDGTQLTISQAGFKVTNALPN